MSEDEVYSVKKLKSFKTSKLKNRKELQETLAHSPLIVVPGDWYHDILVVGYSCTHIAKQRPLLALTWQLQSEASILGGGGGGGAATPRMKILGGANIILPPPPQ